MLNPKMNRQFTKSVNQQEDIVGVKKSVMLAAVTMIFLFASGAAQKPFAQPAGGFIGVEVKDAKSRPGAEIVQVQENSSAQKSGLKPGNIIVKVNRVKIQSARDFDQAMAGKKEGAFVDIGVIQNNIKVTRGVRVMPLPGSGPQATGGKTAPLKEGKQVYGYMESTTVDDTPQGSAGSAADLSIAALNISSERMAPGALFDLSLDLFARDRKQGDMATALMTYTVEKGGRVIMAKPAETLTLPNGLPVTIIRKCKADDEKGAYTITIKVEMEGISAEKSAGFQVE